MPGRIQAVIFDMDGLLVDSEPFCRRAHVLALADVGVTIAEDEVRQITGLRAQECAQFWATKYTWRRQSVEALAASIVNHAITLLRDNCTPMRGAKELILKLAGMDIPMAIASSSSMKMIEVVTTKLGIKAYLQTVQSAEDEPYGKPNPAVYLSTAQRLGVAPEQCLVFEDSVNGVIAAKAARMMCVAVPEPMMRNDKRYGIADLVIDSLADFPAELLQAL